jgi:hypothetical protein
MTPRGYTTRSRAKRIALHYLDRPHPFRRWKLILSIAVPAVAALWLVASAARGDYRLYNSGAVSTAHAMFGSECARCHLSEGRTGFFLPAADAGCISCHQGPTHNRRETFAPTCASCHVEHKGRTELAAMADQQCTQCHGRLQTTDGVTAFTKEIGGFTRGHPEFAVTVAGAGTATRVRLDDRARLRDNAQIKLNHAKHLKAGLKGLEELKSTRGSDGILQGRDGLQLTCAYCHEPDERRGAIAPITFQRHCGPACHPLDFDGRLPDVAVPHDTPPVVHAFLRGVFSESFDVCQAVQRSPASAPPAARARCQALELVKGAAPAEAEPDRARGGRLGRRAEAEEPPPDAPRGARLGQRAPVQDAPAEEAPADAPRGRPGRRAEPEGSPAPTESWTVTQVRNAESLVFTQRCEFCHALVPQPEALPAVAPTAIPARWMPHARFDHGSHRPLACAECHRAAESTETTDVLLPSIKTCVQCHRGASSPTARSGCVECHVYHDKTADRDMNGPFTIRELAHRSAPAARAATTTGGPR